MGISSSSNTRENPYPAEHTDLKKILLLGNPGRGKSLIGNTLVGREVFESGESIGTGLTTKVQSHISEQKWLEGWCVVDMPGVMDIEQDYESLATDALYHAGKEVMMIFVVQLNGLRADPQDAWMIDSFMTACGGQLTSFGILTNKITPTSAKKLLTDDQKQLKRIMRDLTKNCGNTKSKGRIAPLVEEKGEPTIFKDNRNLQMLQNLTKEVKTVNLEKDRITDVAGGNNGMRSFLESIKNSRIVKGIKRIVELVSGALRILVGMNTRRDDTHATHHNTRRDATHATYYGGESYTYPCDAPHV